MWFIIENEKEYNRAISRFEELKYSKQGTDEDKEKRLLVKLISDFEETNYHFDDIDPIEIIKIRMKEFGLKQKDLQVTNKGLISKILNYKRPLS
ncbi:transcriptional regulator [Sphingobacterium sp.]|uniref:helix-turn-helix domain-containing protein n=1 Tax=Sphingobacterium sp. TaxID=341027 RepID=UPI0028ADB2D3|nr:transcriptional regulator [Sphingobacterium sp.]